MNLGAEMTEDEFIENIRRFEILLREMASNRSPSADASVLMKFWNKLFRSQAISLSSQSTEMKELIKQLCFPAPNCPMCNSLMVIKTSKFGSTFFGCTEFPTCRGVRKDNKEKSVSVNHALRIWLSSQEAEDIVINKKTIGDKRIDRILNSDV